MAMQWKGVQGVAEEASWGDFTAHTRKIAVDRGSAQTIRAGEDLSRATATRYLYRSVLLGYDEQYDWEQVVTGRNIGEVLKWALGTSTPSALGGGEYQHDIAIADTLPSFTLSVDRGIAANPLFQIAGCRINTLALENGARGILRATIDGVGKMHRLGSGLTVSAGDKAEWANNNPFVFYQLNAQKALDGATLSKDSDIERVLITLANNLVTDKSTSNGSKYIADLPIGELGLTGAYDKEFASVAEFNNFIGNKQLDLTFIWTGFLMTTERYKLTLDIPDATITSLPLPEIAGGSDRQTHTVEFVAKYFPTDDKVISAQLINNIASY